MKVACACQRLPDAKLWVTVTVTVRSDGKPCSSITTGASANATGPSTAIVGGDSSTLIARMRAATARLLAPATLAVASASMSTDGMYVAFFRTNRKRLRNIPGDRRRHAWAGGNGGKALPQI